MKTDYVLLASYAGGTKKDFKKSKSTTIEQAIDQTVRRVPGGEFLMNAKIVLVSHGGHKVYFAAEGDVYGEKNVNPTENENREFRGYKVGDGVIWGNNVVGFKKGKITAIKENTCIIETEDGKTIEKKYADITKQ